MQRSCFEHTSVCSAINVYFQGKIHLEQAMIIVVGADGCLNGWNKRVLNCC